jgi:hypothetical protein
MGGESNEWWRASVWGIRSRVGPAYDFSTVSPVASSPVMGHKIVPQWKSVLSAFESNEGIITHTIILNTSDL